MSGFQWDNLWTSREGSQVNLCLRARLKATQGINFGKLFRRKFQDSKGGLGGGLRGGGLGGGGGDIPELGGGDGRGQDGGPAGWEAAAGFLASSLLVTSVVGLKLAPLATAGPWPFAPIILERSGACKRQNQIKYRKGEIQKSIRKAG